MNLYAMMYINKLSAVQQCKQCKRQCVAVRKVVIITIMSMLIPVVRAQCARQCAAVFLVVYGSAHGSVRLSVRQCCSVRQCAVVRQCAAVCGSAAECGSTVVCGSVRGSLCGSEHGSVRLRSARDSVQQCAW